MYTLDQLRGFVAVAEEGHFVRAAERLNMTQPPLSRQIQKLEQQVGVELLSRTSRATVLTPAGRAFLDDARKILSLAAAAPLHAQRITDGSEGTVKMAFTATAALSFLGPWAQMATVGLPNVDLVLSELVSGAQIDALLAAEIDLGLVREVPRSESLNSRLVHNESLLLAVPDGHPLTRVTNPNVQDVANYDVVTYDHFGAHYFFELIVSVFREAGARPRYTQHVSQVSSVLALVSGGLGVAFVPEGIKVLKLPNMRFIRVSGVRANCVELYCVWKTGNENPALTSLLNLAANEGILPSFP